MANPAQNLQGGLIAFRVNGNALLSLEQRWDEIRLDGINLEKRAGNILGDLSNKVNILMLLTGGFSIFNTAKLPLPYGLSTVSVVMSMCFFLTMLFAYIEMAKWKLSSVTRSIYYLTLKLRRVKTEAVEYLEECRRRAMADGNMVDNADGLLNNLQSLIRRSETICASNELSDFDKYYWCQGAIHIATVFTIIYLIQC